LEAGRMTKTSLKKKELQKQFNPFTALSNLSLELEAAKYAIYSGPNRALRVRKQQVIRN
jgi:ABC-type uncharacterized transport system ATPase subunit